MIPTSAEPIINHLGLVDGVCPETFSIVVNKYLIYFLKF